MLEHSSESRAYVETEIDRYLAVPGQATSYTIGSFEIQRLRRDAEEKLGARFDVKAFHDVARRRRGHPAGASGERRAVGARMKWSVSRMRRFCPQAMLP
jgi:hypothetical protein